MTSLKRVVARRNSAMFVFPKGWLTRAQAADQLDCSEERVNEVLKHALKAGDVERKEFPVWDNTLERVVRVAGYRVAAEPTPGVTCTSAERKIAERIAQFVARKGGKKNVTVAQIQDAVRVHRNGMRSTLPTGDIKSILAGID